MKKRTVFALLFAVLASCVSIGAATSGIPQLDPGYKIETLRTSPQITPPCWSYVSFLSAAYLRAKEDKKAATELREPNYESIPPGGLIIIQVNGRTINSAHGEDYTFIVLDADGVEVAREHGSDSIPNHIISARKTIWFGVHAVVLVQEVSFPLRIRIVNSIYPDDYYEYSIVETQK